MTDPDDSDSTDSPVTGNWSVFGDSLGLTVFLATLTAAVGTWQVGFFITDTYAVANGLVNLADGHFTVDRIYYSLTLGSQPGLHIVDGQLYARNYGQATAALPVYYALEGLATVTRLELSLAGAWSLLVLATVRQVGVVLDRRRSFQLAGAVLAVVAFAASLPLARPVDPDLTGILALQALSVLAAAVLALALYRLCATIDEGSRRLGVVTGLGAVVATPLWFWAAIPKRHTVIAAAVATLLFWFAASREEGPRVGFPLAGRVRGMLSARQSGGGDSGVDKALALRVMAYALAALVAWVHAFEGVVILGALVVTDLATASSNSRRALVALAVGLAVGLAPVVATNVAVSGNPVEPPRLTESFEPGGDIELGPGGTVQPANNSSGADIDRGTDSDESSGVPSIGALAERVRTSSVFGYAERVVSETRDAPGRLYHTYVRSGRVDTWVRYDVNDQEVIELSLAESFPLVGGLIGSLVGWGIVRVRQLRHTERGDSRLRSDGGQGRPSPVRRILQRSSRIRRADPSRQTGWFALLLVVGYAVLYFPLLPLHTQLTVRYILPALPAFVYLVAHCREVRRAVTTAGRSLAGGYAVALAAGLALTVLTFPALDPAVGEVMQLHALVNLGTCAVLAIVTGVVRGGLIDDTRITAVALGVAGAATTVLVGRMQLVYFEYGTYTVPVVRQVADVLAAGV